jgi:DNA ligase (NAD+)
MIKSAIKLFSLACGNQTAAGKTFHPSQTCPECGSKLFAEAGGAEPVWLCPNPDCPAQVRRGLVHWCSEEVMDIAGGDAVLVAKLVGKGLARDVAELYRIKVAELAALEGMDKDSAQKFFDAVTASMKRDAWRLLFGLNIPLVGAAEAQALGKGFPTVDAVFAAGVPRLMQDGGVSEAVAQSIVRWHSDNVNRKLVKRLDKLGVNLKSELHRAAPAKMPSS